MGKKHNDQEENGTYDTLLLKETHVHLGKKVISTTFVEQDNFLQGEFCPL
jgi:hypothetical protein